MAPDPSTANNLDVSLLERVKGGDQEAFALLYDRLSPLLYGLVCKILNDAKESEDVLQEGFLHIWRKSASYDSTRSSPSTWAVMIFRHKAIDRLRSRQRRDQNLEHAAMQPLFTANSDSEPVESALRREERGAVRAALEQIPTDQREAISLAFFSGLTQVEISARLNEPLGTIKARIRRGMLKLRESLTLNL